MAAKPLPNVGRGTLPRGRPTFLTRAATDDTAQLTRRTSLPTPATRSHQPIPLTQGDGPNTSYESSNGLLEVPPRQHELGKKVFAKVSGVAEDAVDSRGGSGSRQRRKPALDALAGDSITGEMIRNGRSGEEKSSLPKVGSVPRPIGGTEKLDTFSGVFVPTSLNVLSILMFIRFGFILGQAGLLGMLGMLVVAYLINLVTTMSISAIASNGTVRGGGAYYLISRSLGPEFGGSIGIVFYLGFVFNTGMNAVGLIDCLNQNFGSVSGNWSGFLPEGDWWQYLWSTAVLLLCTAICLAGSAIFARASNGLLLVLLIATLSIPVSTLILKPFESDAKQFVQFTGWSMTTLRQNFLPKFTKRAAGSQLEGRENYQDLFGILFPATGGIFAGASMSGDLKNPSKSIPKGTLYGLAVTFSLYALVIIAMAASISRQSFYMNVNIIQHTNLSGILILLGECATTLFSVLMGVIGPAKLLQAVARDSLLPGLSIFGQGSRKTDEPTYAIFFTFAVAQITMLFDINRIASFITMTYLMTFFVTNLACFLLRISSAPNFRPSFHYFSWWSAALGALLSVITMFFVDGGYATGCVGILVLLFLLIHFTTPPKSWGDVSQSLIYHQVRKYLLRLRTEHVKFWRPQILLFVNDPRRGYKLIQFCNSLKKGSLFILGHVIVTNNFGASVPEARRQQAAWTKFIDFSKVKAFINVAISSSIEYGARNIVLSAGLGGMRPNIVVMGFYNLQQFRQEQPLVDVPSPPPERKVNEHRRARRNRSRSQLKGELPTDACYVEKRTDAQSYVLVLEDMILKLQINVAIAVGFGDLELPDPKGGNTKKYIDLWPIQMSAEIVTEGTNVLTTNFDTYTLILQLGCILNTVPSYKKSYGLRVIVFVEYESDVEEERQRVSLLLENLRIEGEVLVVWLASGDVKSYRTIVNGEDISDAEVEDRVEKVLEDEDWWHELQKVRGKVRTGDISAVDALSITDDIEWPSSSFQNNRKKSNVVRFGGLRKLMDRSGRRSSFGNLSSLGVSLGMRTHRLDDELLSRHASQAGASDESDSNEEAISIDSDSADDGSDVDVISLTASEGDGSPMSAAYISKPGSKKSSLNSRKSRASSRKTQDDLSQYRIDNLGAEDLMIDIDSPDQLNGAERRGRPGVRDDAPDISAARSRTPSLNIPQVRSRASSPGHFDSSPIPTSRIASEEDAGPSIMFADEPHPRRQQQHRTVDFAVEGSPSVSNGRSIYSRKPDESESPPRITPANGYPAAASVPLSFNDLPCRAQHLILNELITMHSEDTAVIFTTLPAPVEGTYKSEAESLGYVSDLEVLCGGLPPVMMVHSNSMTVTMNL